MLLCFCFSSSTGETRSKHKKQGLWLIPKHFALYIYRILQARSGECPFLPVPDCPSRPIGQGGRFHVCSCAHMRVHKGSVALRPLILGTDKSGTGRSKFKIHVQVDVLLNRQLLDSWLKQGYKIKGPQGVSDRNNKHSNLDRSSAYFACIFFDTGNVCCRHRRFAEFHIARKGCRFRISVRISAATWRPQTPLAN